uniref:Fibronectin type-III domain-containing protein n=1 Tax=Amphimedon queenslandica TaxID=400682 RepID=A0A1X7V5J1_AMPQE
RKSRSSVKMKPRSTAHKTECIDMTYSVITPLDKIRQRHILARNYFTQLPGMMEEMSTKVKELPLPRPKEKIIVVRQHPQEQQQQLAVDSNEVISQCPPSSGIYLRHNGNCYTNNGSFFTDGSIRSTPLECVLPGATLNGGQWIGPNGTVPCDGGNNQNVQCTTGSGASLSVHINPANGFLEAPGDGQYMCCLPTSCSTPGTNIITATIFRFAEIESFTVADLPSDMTVYPQEYKLNCIKIGFHDYVITMSISNTTLTNYPGSYCKDYGNTCSGTVLVSSTFTIRYTVDITWDGMNVSNGAISQSTTGDQMYQCRVADHPDANENRTRTLTIKVPATAPSSLTEVNKTATTITVSWTALDSSDADGYVVNVTSDTDTVQTVQVEGSSNNTITLNGLRGGTTYSITVRAYQQLLGPASNISVFTHCQREGIYLGYNGNCYPNGSYFHDNTVKAVIKAISCVLPGTSLTTGQWVRVADTSDPVDCNSNSASDPFLCTNVTSPDATLNLYLAQSLPAAQEGWYKCCLPTDCSDPNTNIIFANIFRFVQIASIYVNLPLNMTMLSQNYTIHCIKTGYAYGYNFNLQLGDIQLTECTSPCDNSYLLHNSNHTYDHAVTITWDGMTVSSGSISQSTTGDQTYQCRVADHPDANAIRIRNVTIKVPATAPSSLTEVNKTATTITVSWTALDSSDADGYVVNVTSDTDTVQTVQVEGSSNNTITLTGLRGGTTYSITVRIYQQLLGPASTISVQTLPVINSINWTLVSSITQLNNTQYRIDCLTTTDINPSTDVYWLVNEVMKSNSKYIYTSINVLTYNNTLLVYPDLLGVLVNVTCIAMIGGVNYSQSVILHAPSGPPNNVRGFILNATSIKVNWTTSSETNGYVIEYTTGGVTRNVVSISKNEIVLTDLSPMSTYTISVYSYIDLPSVNSTVTVLRFDVPSPVTSLSVSNVSTTSITVNWTIPSSDNYVTYYTISYTPSCPQLSSVNETVSVGPHQSTTTYSYTLIGLYSGMNYTITVRAGNVLGGSDPRSIYGNTLSIAPTGVADFLFLLQPINNLTWNEVNCSERNGLITGYTVIISNSSITYNLTSTERYIILNDLVFGTEYNISVAAVNSVGRGPFSDPIVVEIGIVPGPVGSVSSIMETTWGVISWSVPSYIPSDYSIITYEIGYHILESGNCSMVDDDDIDIQMLQFSNSTNDDTFINITGLNDMSCYIFGVRAYTDNGYGEWTVISNETLELPTDTISDNGSNQGMSITW